MLGWRLHLELNLDRVSQKYDYDTLPDIGYRCGYNLIAPSSIAVGLRLEGRTRINSWNGNGTIIVFGTLGEEGGGSKRLPSRNGFVDGSSISRELHADVVRCR